MNFFGITAYGPQNYFQDMLKDGYQEPVSKEDVGPLMKKVKETSTCPSTLVRPDETLVTIMDDLGYVNGFSYGSFQRFRRMKQRAVMKPVGPADIYRLPPTTYFEYGWWLCDPDLTNETWYQNHKRYPQPCSPYTRILDKVKKNNRYASLF